MKKTKMENKKLNRSKKIKNKKIENIEKTKYKTDKKVSVLFSKSFFLRNKQKNKAHNNMLRESGY